MRSLNEGFTLRSEVQNVEFQKLSGKLQLSATINTQLNDELNEKTEEICQLHSANTKLNTDIGKLEAEIRHMLDNERRMVEQVAGERESAAKTNTAYSECEVKLKTVTDEHSLAKSKISVLSDEVSV